MNRRERSKSKLLSSVATAGTPVAAAFYTILESAKAAQVPPARYLRAVIAKAMSHVGPREGAALLPEEYRAHLNT